MTVSADDRYGAPAAARSTRGSYGELLARLNQLSVQHYCDPMRDIDWDAPAHRLDPEDPRFCIADTHALARTAWYAGLDPATRARFGLNWIAQQLKYGIGFEAVLCRGLLEFAQTLPNESLEYRYVMHEVIEEGRHSLMFQQFIDRSGMPTQVVSGPMAWIDDRIAHLGRKHPVLFFFTVLSGEIFVDQQNRAALKRPQAAVHPLYRQVLKFHVMEEARHVCFAERYLREHLPELSERARMWMGCLLPPIFYDAARMMLTPDAALARRFAIPRDAMLAAFGPNSDFTRQLAEATRPVRELCREHGLMRAPHAFGWRRLAGAA